MLEKRRDLIHRHPYSTNLQKRIYLFLLDHEDADGFIRIGQQEIADAMGVTRPSVNRALRSGHVLSANNVIWSWRDGRRNVYWFINEFAANPRTGNLRNLLERAA